MAPHTGFEPATPSGHGFQDRFLTTRTYGIYLAGALGLEPRVPVLETGGLPLTDTPIFGE